MCRNIKNLYNFDPAVSDEEIHAASVQFVRKVSGFNKPSTINAAAFDQAVKDISVATQTLLDNLTTSATPRNREVEADKAKARSRKRFGHA